MIQDLWAGIQLQSKAHAGAEVTLESGQPQRIQKGKAEETQYPQGYEQLPTSSTLATSLFCVAFQSCISFNKSKKRSSHLVVIQPTLCVPSSPPGVCPSCAPRQLRHSRVCTVTDSCTPDELTRSTISLPAVPGPSCTVPLVHERPASGTHLTPPALQHLGGAGEGAPNRNWFVS